MRDLISKTVKYYKAHGFIRTIKRILILLKPFEHRSVIMLHKKITSSGLLPVRNLNIRLAKMEDIDDHYKDMWTTKEEAIEALKKGHILFLVRDGTVNTLYLWIHLSTLNIPWLWVKNLTVPGDVAYLATAYVPPQCQGRFIFKRALKFVEKYLLENTKVDKLFAIIEPKNAVSLGIGRLSGYALYQDVNYFKIAGIRVYIVSPLGNDEPRHSKIFIQSHHFWNIFSSVLRNDEAPG